MQKKLLLMVCTLLSGAASAAELSVRIDVPQLNVAEYHRPYIAAWLERPDQSVAAHLNVWYDVNLKEHEGAKWLKDMRLWWRRIGRDLKLPADGMTGATRAPGAHELRFGARQAPLVQLEGGDYRLVVEAVREVGGRELIEIPFRWPATEARQLQAQGKQELGAVVLTLQP
jgi:hypothetical protein